MFAAWTVGSACRVLVVLDSVGLDLLHPVVLVLHLQ